MEPHWYARNDAQHALHLTHHLETLHPGQGWDLDDRYTVWRSDVTARYILRTEETGVSRHRTASGAVLAWIELTRPHNQDTDCTVGPDHLCTTCSVDHSGPPCPGCGQVAYHRPGCKPLEIHGQLPERVRDRVVLPALE